MKNFSMVCVFLLIFSELGAPQAADLSSDFSVQGEVGLYSDYRTRGISQTHGKPALQGNLVLFHSSGAYLGVFSSNVEFSEIKTRQELDFYGGYYWQINDDISLNAAYFDYTYSNASFLNVNEYFTELKAYGFSLGAWYIAENQTTLYKYLSYKFSFPNEMSLDMRYGIADYKDPLLVSSSGSTREEYSEWEVRFIKKYSGLKFAASYIDTDLSRSECASYNGFDDVCDATVVISVSKPF